MNAPTAATTKPAPTVTKVKMDDGREVEFTGNRRLLKKVAIADGKVSVRLDLINGETRTFVIPEKLLLNFAGHGASQKYGDTCAGITDPAKMVEALDDLDENIQAGNWEQVAEGTASGMSGASILAKALVTVTGTPIDKVREYLGKLDAKTKIALRSDPSVAPAIKKLEDERAARAALRGATAPKVDVSGTLAALKGLGAAPATGPASVFNQGDGGAAVSTGDAGKAKAPAK